MVCVRKQARRKSGRTVEMGRIGRASDRPSVLDDDLGAPAIKIAGQTLSTPTHRAGRVEVRDGEDEGLSLHVRELIVTPLQLVSDGLGETKRGRAEKQRFTLAWRRDAGRVHVVEAPLRIGGDRLHPSLAAKAIANVKVRRLERLADVQALLSKRREQLRFPHPRVEIPGLAVSDPVPVRVWKGEIKLVED